MNGCGAVFIHVVSSRSIGMTKPRKQQISLEATPFYHCVSRCVRRAYLCGYDRLTGRSYEHRRDQIESDILRLASVFFIDVAAYSVMSNHYHVVLHVDRDKCLKASAKTIAQRWHQIFSGKEVSRKFMDGEYIEPYEREQLDSLIDRWRPRLYDISWFMKVLNENIAKRANQEDECSGHFWQARYKSQALLDEQSVLSAMAYVDLNPVRAAMAETPEQSDHTSIKLRIAHWKNKSRETHGKEFLENDEDFQPDSVMPFVGNPRQPMPPGIAFNLVDYLQLVDWTGRQIRDDKRGAIDTDLPPVLQRLDISPTHWIELCTHFEDRFKGLVGSKHSLKNLISLFGLTRRANRSNSTLLFS